MIGSAAALATPAVAKSPEHWPAIDIKRKWVKELNERFAGTSGIFHDDSYKSFLADYNPGGNYLNWGTWREFKDDGEIVIADGGLPKVHGAAGLYWNPVTLSHYALTHHGRMTFGKSESRAEFFKAADKLIQLQRADGGLPYPSMAYRKFKLPEGWISAMAQGNALSVFYRAWLLTQDKRYLKAGSLAFASLMRPTRKGGPATTLADLHPSLSGHPFLAEYPTDPIDYTLNGYLFAILGLHDWSHVSQKASVAFKRNIETLERLLPYHDIDGFSTYDLSHIVLKLLPYVAAPYLGIHVYLLHALAGITGSATLNRYERRWAAKLDKMNREVRITAMSPDLPSPQPAGTTIKFQLKAEGGGGKDQLYQFGIKRGTEWTTAQPFSPSNTFAWTPQEPDNYVIGFYVKEAGSSREWDNFRYQRFTIT